jgi:hypothetical protein
VADPNPRFYDLNGALIPPAVVEEAYTAIFGFTPSLPAWLSADFGTVTYWNTALSGNGGLRQPWVQVATPATIDAPARIKTTPTLTSNSYKAMSARARGLALSAASGIDLDFGIIGSNCGAIIRQGAADAQARLDIIGAGNATVATANLNLDLLSAGEGRRPRDLGIVVYPQAKAIVVTDGDQEVTFAATSLPYYDASASWVNGDIQLSLGIKTKAAVTQNFRASRIDFTLWHVGPAF